ncbi:MAG: hydroxymethylglutaryl-CoA synthase [Candidatus Helarchaeales archaeon]
MVGIMSYGVYVPRYRISSSELKNVWNKSASGVKEKSVPYRDEDTITLALAAARNSLNSRSDVQDINALYFASVSSPFIEKQVSTLLVSMLGLNEKTRNGDVGGSARAGVVALESAANHCTIKERNAALVITSDVLMAKPGSNLEGAFGAGATSWVIGNKDPIAIIEGFSSYSSEISERWRHVNDDYHSGDDRFVRQFGIIKTMKAALLDLAETVNRELNDFDHVVLQQNDGRIPLQIAKSMKLDRNKLKNGNMVEYFGDLGVSSVFMGLASILDIAIEGQTILCASWGSGGTHAFSLKVTSAIESERASPPVEYFVNNKELISYPTYLQYLGVI